MAEQVASVELEDLAPIFETTAPKAPETAKAAAQQAQRDFMI